LTWDVLHQLDVEVTHLSTVKTGTLAPPQLKVEHFVVTFWHQNEKSVTFDGAKVAVFTVVFHATNKNLKKLALVMVF